MTDLKTKLAALHPNMTPGTWEVEYDPVSAQDHATLIELPGKAGAPGTWIARTEHNWNDASYNERRISWKEAETNAEWIALTGSEANRAQIIAALDMVDECERVQSEMRDMIDGLRHENGTAWALLEKTQNLLRTCGDFIQHGARYSHQDFDLRQQIAAALEPRP